MPQLLTILCDRCDARAPERRLPRGALDQSDLPEGWVRLNGLDLCEACWASYCEWEGAHIRQRKETR